MKKRKNFNISLGENLPVNIKQDSNKIKTKGNVAYIEMGENLPVNVKQDSNKVKTTGNVAYIEMGKNLPVNIKQDSNKVKTTGNVAYIEMGKSLSNNVKKDKSQITSDDGNATICLGKPYDVYQYIDKNRVYSKTGNVSINMPAEDLSQVSLEYKKSVSYVKTNYITYTDKEKVESVVITNSPATLTPKEGSKLSLSIQPANYKYSKITWTTGNSHIVDIDKYGRITAVQEGTTIITVDVDGVTYSTLVEVSTKQKHKGFNYIFGLFRLGPVPD